ncbi:hypothetical protein D3C72_2256530 [compost metagenome]
MAFLGDALGARHRVVAHRLADEILRLEQGGQRDGQDRLNHLADRSFKLDALFHDVAGG